MSNKKTPLTVFEKIKATLKLGDDGKLMSFFGRIDKFIKREIKALETSRTLTVSTYEQERDQLVDKLQDAVEALDSQYQNVTVDQIATNSLQESFMGTYLDRIRYAENTVNDIENQIEELDTEHASDLSSINDQIEERQRILNNLNGVETSTDDSAE